MQSPGGTNTTQSRGTCQSVYVEAMKASVLVVEKRDGPNPFYGTKKGKHRAGLRMARLVRGNERSTHESTDVPI